MDTWRLQCLLIPKWNSGSFQEDKGDENGFWMPDQMSRISIMSIENYVTRIWTLDTIQPQTWSKVDTSNDHQRQQPTDILTSFFWHSNYQQQIWTLYHISSQHVPSSICHPAYLPRQSRYHSIIAYSWWPIYDEIVTALQHDLDIVRWGSYIWFVFIIWRLDSAYHNWNRGWDAWCQGSMCARYSALGFQYGQWLVSSTAIAERSLQDWIRIAVMVAYQLHLANGVWQHGILDDERTRYYNCVTDDVRHYWSNADCYKNARILIRIGNIDVVSMNLLFYSAMPHVQTWLVMWITWLHLGLLRYQLA